MESFERELDDIVNTGIPCWLETELQPPNRKHSDKNTSMIRMMLSAIFQHKYPEYDPKFLIAWIPEQKKYRIAISELNRYEQVK